MEKQLATTDPHKGPIIDMHASDKEVTRVLKEAGHLGYARGYPTNSDYERYVLVNIQTIQDAYAFMEQLIRHSYHHRPRWAVHAKWVDTCTKVSVARRTYEGDSSTFWCERPRMPLSSARLTHCGCHGVGAFDVRKDTGRPPWAFNTPKERVRDAYRDSRFNANGCQCVIIVGDRVLGTGETAAKAWAAADFALEEQVVARWYQGNGRQLAPAMFKLEANLAPCLSKMA